MVESQPGKQMDEPTTALNNPLWPRGVHSAVPSVPEGCGLSLYPGSEVKDGLVDVRAECACEQWAYVIKDVPVNSTETQGRAAWMRHLAGGE